MEYFYGQKKRQNKKVKFDVLYKLQWAIQREYIKGKDMKTIDSNNTNNHNIDNKLNNIGDRHSEYYQSLELLLQILVKVVNLAQNLAQVFIHVLSVSLL